MVYAYPLQSQEKSPLIDDIIVDNIADRLRWAIRHGRIDLARRLQDDLAHLGREVKLIELAAASSDLIGGGL